MANKLSRFSQPFKNAFEEALVESVVIPIQEALDETYAEKEREMEDMIDSGVVKPRLDVSAQKVFLKLKVDK